MEGFHRIGRIILAGFTVVTLAVVVVLNPEVKIETLGLIASPALGYIGLKGSGTKPA